MRHPFLSTVRKSRKKQERSTFADFVISSQNTSAKHLRDISKTLKTKTA
ncbi:MAG: hypothetical protein ACI4CY_02950 [Candidatus Gastranaerophilaceae bacterium]